MMMEEEADDLTRKGSPGKSRSPRAKKSRKSNPLHRGSGGRESAPSQSNPPSSESKDAGEGGRAPEATPDQSPSVSGEEGPPVNPYPPEV